jgi:hypothetical protein
MVFQAWRTAEAVRRFNCTPPTSVLCVMVSEYSFSTTGKPEPGRLLDRVASVRAMCVSTVGMP